MKASLLFGAIFLLAVIVFSVPMLSMVGTERTAATAHVPQNIPSPTPYENPSAPMPDQAASTAGEDSPAGGETPEAYEAEPFGEYSRYGVLSFQVLDRATGKVNEVSVRDYVRGAVASEMPAAFHPEALKAQAVAAHTYALYNHYMQQRSPDPALKGADFSANPGNREGYMTEKKAREFYGESADMYWSKVCEAVDGVLPYIMEYEGEPIVAAYHAISAGRTEAAENVWIGSAPYLVPADSEGCLLAPDYEVSASVSAENVKRTLAAAYPEMDLSGDPATWLRVATRSESGYITEIEAGGIMLHGKVIRELFGLRSHNLDIACDGKAFTFTAYGHGHGVGLSQYGADFLARQGSTFDEILENYYSGIIIRQVDFETLGG